MTDQAFDKEQRKRINEYLTPERQKQLLNLITRSKYGKDGFILDLNAFEDEFKIAYRKCYTTFKDYQRIYLRHIGDEDSDFLVDTLIDLGFKETDIILVNN